MDEERRSRLVEPRGYGLVSVVSTAMLVGGVGLAWTGLLLAAAGGLLSYIEFKELRRLNPWLMPEGAGAGESPLLTPVPMRIARISTVITILGAVAALFAVQLTGEDLAAIPPALITGLLMLFFNARMRRALSEPPPR